MLTSFSFIHHNFNAFMDFLVFLSWTALAVETIDPISACKVKDTKRNDQP